MKKNKIIEFEKEVQCNLDNIKKNSDIKELSKTWMRESHFVNYDYNYSWLGRPIIQMPQDMLAMQEIIWRIKPDLIIETGIAHGGSLIFYASILELCGGKGRVMGIDIDIREHNRKEIEKHPMFKYIDMLEGSSIDENIVKSVYEYAKKYKNILVVLDSNHTHEHVLAELNMYASLVKEGGYLVVFDTLIEDMPNNAFVNRPWGIGNNPKTAVYEFLNSTDRFVIDEDINAKLLLSVAPDGYLRCIK